MIIRDHATGQPYQLSPDTTLQIERTNPFFNDYGEQSLPLDIPDTPLNRQLTGQPGELANTARPERDRMVDIEDGEYHVRAHRQVLSARRGGNISTSYLLEQSNLYAKIGGKQLIDVFDGQYVHDRNGISTKDMNLDARMAFLDGLKDHQDPHYDIFPVAMTDTGGGGLGYRLLNAYGCIMKHLDGDSYEFFPEPYSSGLSILQWLNGPEQITLPGGTTKARNRITFFNDTTINLQRGYYMSPFIRAIYVLECVIESLGYTLQYPGKNGIGTPDPVMTRMVFVNNTIDACVHGTEQETPSGQAAPTSGILISDIVPDCTCSDLLDIFRYKFGQEFIVDDITHTVTMRHFSTMLNSAPVDLTSHLVGRPQIEYSESQQRIVLVPAAAQSGDTSTEITTALAKYPAAVFDHVRGGWTVTGHCGFRPVTELVIDGNAGYNVDDHTARLESDEHKSPDRIPSMVALTDSGARANVPFQRNVWTFPYIGDERALHSTLIDRSTDDSPALEERPQLDIMLLLPYTDYKGYHRGTLTDYDYYKFYSLGLSETAGIGGSLCYHGADGLYERYWRSRDYLTRNALNKVRASLLLPASLKMTLSPLSQILLHGTSLLIDTLTIALGTDNAIESTLLTATAQTDGPDSVPSQAPYPDDSIYISTGYHWKLRRIYELVTRQEYEDNTDKLSPLKIYPKERPSASNQGTVCCQQYQYYKMGTIDISAILPFLFNWDELWYVDPIEGWHRFNYGGDIIDVGRLYGISFYDGEMHNDGYLEQPHDNYFKIISELVCVSEQSS